MIGPNFPRISFTSQQLAQINDMSLNEVYKIEVTIQMTGKRKAEKSDIPTHGTGEGIMPNSSMLVGEFEIKDVQIKDDYADEYAKKMSAAIK